MDAIGQHGFSATRVRMYLTLGLAVALASSCRSQKVPEPSPAIPESAAAPPAAPRTAPSQLPRFAWTAPLSIPVEESLEKSGQKQQLQFHLDVCPGTDGTLLLTHRDMHLLLVNGVPAASALSASEQRQIEVATSTLPTMVIDRAGTFLRATGLMEMVDRLALASPGKDFSQLRHDLAAGTSARAVLEAELANRWLDWVGLWLRYDPSRGSGQEVSAAVGASQAAMILTYKDTSPDGRVKLLGHRALTQEDTRDLAQSLNSLVGDAELDMAQFIRGGESVMDVETDWPDIHPRRAHSRNTVRFMLGGQDQSVVEEHDYRFDWLAAAPGDARCGPPR